jgi:hypothetical protein
MRFESLSSNDARVASVTVSSTGGRANPRMRATSRGPTGSARTGGTSRPAFTELLIDCEEERTLGGGARRDAARGRPGGVSCVRSPALQGEPSVKSCLVAGVSALCLFNHHGDSVSIEIGPAGDDPDAFPGARVYIDGVMPINEGLRLARSRREWTL